MKSRKLVRVSQKDFEAHVSEIKSEIDFAKTTILDNPIGLYHLVTGELELALIGNGFVLATFVRADGTLLYANTKQKVDMYHKVPDYKFVGDGKYIYA